MKIAIIHDMIVDKGGAERVLIYFHEAFPEATIYTTAYLPSFSYPDFKNMKIKSTFYDRLAADNILYRKFYFPLGLLASKSIDLRSYDLILQSTTHGAKYAKYSKKSYIISYCYTPFRLVWNPDSYIQVKNSNMITKFAYNAVIKLLKKIDYNTAQRPDEYWAMTKETSERISFSYNKKVTKIINPPVDLDNYFISPKTDNYYLIVSRLEAYKKIDLVIKVFNDLNLPLKIVGRGTQKEYLISISESSKIEFLENVDDKKLSELYANCKALIFPQHEDYGITPIEANASGRPVIGYNKGGILDTVIPYTTDSKKCTAVLFDHQDYDSLINAVKLSESLEFDSYFIRKHAEKFDKRKFINDIRSSVLRSYEAFVQMNNSYQ